MIGERVHCSSRLRIAGMFSSRTWFGAAEIMQARISVRGEGTEHPNGIAILNAVKL